MARKKGGPSRMDLRREHDAAEAREKDEEKDEDEEEEEEDEDEEGDDEEADADAEADDDAGDDDDDEDGPKKKKKKAAPKKKAPAAKKPAAKRSRTPKEVRMKAVWVVFDNASKRVGVFPFKDRKQAEKLLDAKIEEKKTTFYIQLIKEPLEEAEKEPEKPKKK